MLVKYVQRIIAYRANVFCNTLTKKPLNYISMTGMKGQYISSIELNIVADTFCDFIRSYGIKCVMKILI